MKGLSLPILILGLLFVAIGSWFLSNKFCGVSTPGFAVRDGGFNASSKDTYSFSTGKSSLKMTDGTTKSFKLIANHLKNNELKTLSLVGTRYAGETADNLGASRAEAIKKKLVQLKAPGDKIQVSGQTVNNKGLMIDKKVYGGVEFIFGGDDGSTTMEKKTELGSGLAAAAAVSGIGGLTRTFYFPNSKAKLELDSEMQEYVGQLQTYLADNPGSKVIAVGYTDNADRESKNLKRSKDMAKAVRRFFRNDDKIRSAAIGYDGKGSADPEVDHDNAEAANLNNRVVVSIKN